MSTDTIVPTSFVDPTIEEIGRFYLTDLANTPTYKALQERIALKYPTPSNDEDRPIEYYKEITRCIELLLLGAYHMNQPVPDNFN